MWIGVQPQSKGNKPSLAIYEFDEKWNVVQYQMHHIDGLNYAHDFLLLPDYYVFHMTPFAKMSLKGALLVYSGISSPGQLMQYYPDMPSRFVIIPRHANAAHQSVKIVDTDPFHVSAQHCCVKYQVLHLLPRVRACAARDKAIGLSVCLSVCRPNKNCQILTSRRFSDS